MNNKRKSFEAKKAVLYKIHDYLTDKKLLKKITSEEEKQLQEVRSALEYNEQGFMNFYENRIAAYQDLLTELEKAETELNTK